MGRDAPTALLLGIVVLVVLNTLPVSALQQESPPGDGVLLDSDTDLVGQVTIDDRTYEVYRYENFLPYASGIEVYVDGNRVRSNSRLDPVYERLAAIEVLEAEGVENPAERAASITSTATAKTEFRRLAWRRAIDHLGSDEIDRLRAVRDSVREIDGTVSTVLGVVTDTLGLIEWMKETSVAGVSVWDAATSYAPVLVEFEPAMRDIQSELQAWQSAASTTDEALSGVLATLERVERGEDVDYAALTTQFESAANSLRQLQTKSDQAASSLADLSRTSSEIQTNVRPVPVVGAELSDHFRQLSSILGETAGRFDSYSSALEARRTTLDDVRTTATEKRSELVARWQSKQGQFRSAAEARASARTRVFGTIGGTALVVVLLGMTLLRRR